MCCVWHLPKRERIPQAIHTTSDIPTLPEFFRIPFGEMNIPAPMIVPMMIEIPRSRVTFFRSSTLSSGAPAWGSPFELRGSFSPKLLGVGSPLGWGTDTVLLGILLAHKHTHINSKRGVPPFTSGTREAWVEGVLTANFWYAVTSLNKYTSFLSLWPF